MKIKIIFILLFFTFTKIGMCQLYDPVKAIEYAEKWWNGFNTDKYVNYTTFGGDCAAFVSQCLIAGGLDLSKGTNGSGAYVKPDKVISGVPELATHLQKYQNTTYKTTSGGSWGTPGVVAADVVPGDPVFLGSSGTPYGHSIFCVTKENGVNKYNCHSDPAYHEKRDYWTHYITYSFHITSSFPDHCRNCIQDNGETSVDCGGPCPPCGDAPQQKNYMYTTSFPVENNALDRIEIGGVTIKDGQNVDFLAGNEILINSGFEVKNNANFSASATKKYGSLTRDLSQVCDPKFATYLNNGEPLVGLFTGYTMYNIEIFQKNPNGTNLVSVYYTGNRPITSNGLVELWNCRTGRLRVNTGPRYESFFLIGKFEDVNGIVRELNIYFESYNYHL